MDQDFSSANPGGHRDAPEDTLTLVQFFRHAKLVTGSSPLWNEILGKKAKSP
jgi:hypothetical protein